MTPTAEQIDALIAIRNRATDRRDEQIDWNAVDLIDAQLARVPPGTRNDADLLLGRLCAQLPNRAALAALKAAAQESGVEAEWTPAPSAKTLAEVFDDYFSNYEPHPTNAEMIRIVQDAMRNDPPIEY